MVNLIGEKIIVPELLQSNMASENIVHKLIPLLDHKSDQRRTMVKELEKIKTKLGQPGVYQRAASDIIKKTSFNE